MRLQRGIDEYLVLAVALAAAWLGTLDLFASEVTFHLVPETRWKDGQPSPEDFLPSGRIHLYRHGDYEPSLSIPANQPSEVPAGVWYWIAEAPGWVSAASGSFGIDADDHRDRRIVWPVVPACEIYLPDREWQGVSRIDLVSLSRNAVYPIDPRVQDRAAIPAGSFLSYSVGGRGISAISAPGTCKPSESLELDVPETPLPDFQDVMVSVLVPDTLEVSVEDVNATLQAAKTRRGDSYLGPPAASLTVGRRRTFFFLQQPAGRPVKIAFRHPELRTKEVLLSPLGGGVRELEDVKLLERVTLEVALDYRPAREHEHPTLSALLCGKRQRRYFEEVSRDACSRAGRVTELLPGLSTYRIDGLDTGWYVLEASIDGELVFGLGGQVSALVESETPSILQVAADPLEEFHIFGQLLIEGEPVPGQVVLSPFLDGVTDALYFPTDDELFFHMYFFAQTPSRFGRHRLPEALQKTEGEELRGLFDGYQLQACSDDGFCRLFHHRSTFSGGGRMDLDLGEDRSLLARVADRSSGSPIQGALVVVGQRGQPSETLHFVAGKLHRQRVTFESPGTLTDPGGVVRVRGLPAGDQRIGASADGYAPLSRGFSMPEEGRIEISIELSAEDEGSEDPSALTLRFPNRDSVPRAFFLALEADRGVDYHCSKSTDHRGQVRFPDSCLRDDSKNFYLLHPAARMQAISAVQLRQSPEIVAERNRSLPIRIRLATAEGPGMAHRALSFRFRELVLTPNHFLAAFSQTGLSLPFRTDSDGNFDVWLVDSGGDSPDVGLDQGGSILTWHEIYGEPGSLLEIYPER